MDKLRTMYIIFDDLLYTVPKLNSKWVKIQPEHRSIFLQLSLAQNKSRSSSMSEKDSGYQVKEQPKSSDEFKFHHFPQIYSKF